MWDAVVVAGGTARRLGGVDKPALRVGDRRLLDRALAACAGARHIVVVGPRRPTEVAVRWTRESPPGSGPLAALRVGLAALPAGSDVIVVLAGDLPAVDAALVRRLRETLDDTMAGAVATDPTGSLHPLLAAYRRPALDRAISAIGDLQNQPMWKILERLDVVLVPAGHAAADIDTPEELERWTALRGAASMEEWVRSLCAALDVPVGDVDVDAVLDLARDAAHNVDRPAAPVTTFVAGYAAGRRGGGSAATAAATAAAADLARGWRPPTA
ncbi:MAG: molybdenum cofactor guanylyltransferase [Jiangellaceae bacterium]|nr:molybdenum cofactor guanylyltransferase [Jiangellaceae bacterium]